MKSYFSWTLCIYVWVSTNIWYNTGNVKFKNSELFEHIKCVHNEQSEGELPIAIWTRPHIWMNDISKKKFYNQSRNNNTCMHTTHAYLSYLIDNMYAEKLTSTFLHVFNEIDFRFLSNWREYDCTDNLVLIISQAELYFNKSKIP